MLVTSPSGLQSSTPSDLHGSLVRAVLIIDSVMYVKHDLCSGPLGRCISRFYDGHGRDAEAAASTRSYGMALVIMID